MGSTGADLSGSAVGDQRVEQLRVPAEEVLQDGSIFLCRDLSLHHLHPALQVLQVQQHAVQPDYTRAKR